MRRPALILTAALLLSLHAWAALARKPRAMPAAPMMDDSEDLPPPGEAFRRAVMDYIAARKAARPGMFQFKDDSSGARWELKFLKIREASRQSVGLKRQCAIVEFANAAGGPVDLAFEAAEAKGKWKVTSAEVQKADGWERFVLGPSCRRVSKRGP
ncbi:MAG: hypothetical protein HYZ75_02100 [Elusimicrobia bacterium]|nr:hypothetical protein [Elusimicrobiota bacterium]